VLTTIGCVCLLFDEQSLSPVSGDARQMSGVIANNRKFLIALNRYFWLLCTRTRRVNWCQVPIVLSL